MSEDKKPAPRSAIHIEDCHGTVFNFSGSDSTGYDRFVTMKGSTNNSFIAEGVFMNGSVDADVLRQVATSTLFTDIVSKLGPNVSPADVIDAIEARKTAGDDLEKAEINVKKSRLGKFINEVGPDVAAFVIQTLIKVGSS
ncbi:hypothetical protein [Ralstonia sp.]|uniref:hypothetical protein n=1 Tax=Ralstonia sp. TaxID=54061 RepID=UPI0031D5B2DF